MPQQYQVNEMSCRELLSDCEGSGESYNWSKLRRKYLEEDLPSFSEHEEEEIKAEKKYKKYRKGLTFEEIASLHLKKKNLQDFISSIGSVAAKPLRRDVLEHCEKVRISFAGGLSADGVMKLVKNRVEKMIKNKRIKKNWTEEDIKILIWVLSKYVEINDISCMSTGLNENDWEYIANLIPGVTGKGCMFKWLSLKKNNLAQNGWVEEESLLLDFVVKKHGEQNWCAVSEQLYELNNLPNKIYRCPKQCREHWNCYLNPNLKKGPWSKAENILLLKSVKDLNGSKKWAEIVKLFNGRTENALKNRFNLIIEKEIKEVKHGRKKITELELIDRYLDKVYVGQVVGTTKLKSMKALRKKNSDAVWKEYQTRKMEGEEDEYIPEKLSKRRRTLSQHVKKEEEQKSEMADEEIQDLLNLDDPKPFLRDLEHEISHDHDNASYEHLNFVNKDEEQIFEEEDELFSEKLREKDDSYRMCHEFLYPKQDLNINNLNSIPSEAAENNPPDVTAEESLNIDASKVKMVQYSPQILEKLKLDLSRNKFTFIPCTLTQENNIISYYGRREDN